MPPSSLLHIKFPFLECPLPPCFLLNSPFLTPSVRSQKYLKLSTKTPFFLLFPRFRSAPDTSIRSRFVAPEKKETLLNSFTFQVKNVTHRGLVSRNLENPWNFRELQIWESYSLSSREIDPNSSSFRLSDGSVTWLSGVTVRCAHGNHNNWIHPLLLRYVYRLIRGKTKTNAAFRSRWMGSYPQAITRYTVHSALQRVKSDSSTALLGISLVEY